MYIEPYKLQVQPHQSEIEPYQQRNVVVSSVQEVE